MPNPLGNFKPGQPKPEGSGRKVGTPNKRTEQIRAVCDNYQVAERMGQLAQLTFNNLAVLQKHYGESDDGRLAFAKDAHAAHLAEKAYDMYSDLAEFRFAKLRRIDHVGDAPSITNIENRVVVELNIGNPRPVEVVPVVDAHANGSNGHAGNGNGQISNEEEDGDL